MTQATITTTTQGKNKYLYDRRLKKAVLCHPILFFLAQMKNQGKDPGVWLENITASEVEIPELGTFPREEVAFYLQKLQFFEDAGYFTRISQEKSICRQITAADVQASLTNLGQITFELTDSCQMNCYYCGYGDFYCNKDERKKKFMDFPTIKRTIDYLLPFLNSPLNLSHQRDCYIGLYGGEPLLNFTVLEQTVHYVKTLQWLHNKIRFTITTNGLLLDRYMDFLVQHDFNIFISLDGDESNNAYRVLKDGTPTHDRVVKNVKALREKYPDYYNERVFFNSVLHNKNSIDAIFNYFNNSFDKNPSILGLNTKGISDEKADEFWKTYVNENQSLYDSEDQHRIQHEMFIKLPTLQALSGFLFRANDFHYDNYNDLFCTQKEPERYPSDTCMPFSKKFFLTVNGKILPCERIGQTFELGYVTAEGIQLDFQEIADRYNDWFEKIRQQCFSCYMYDQCTQCIFALNLQEKRTLCTSFHDSVQYSGNVASFWDYFENKPALLNRIIKEVIFG